MKKWVLEKLVCPECLPKSFSLDLTEIKADAEEVVEGELKCPECSGRYPIRKGVGVLLPKKSTAVLEESNGYNSKGMLSAYLWSHFSEYFNGGNATDAYQVWASHFRPKKGWALDIGCSVGRLSFELSKTHDRVIGIDTSYSFIQKARELLQNRRLEFDLVVEGRISETQDCRLDQNWQFERVEFLVADALALPFSENIFSTVTSINVLEKVSHPVKHLKDVNKVLRDSDAMFVFSDPFSWDEKVTDPALWLSGRNNGRYKGRGIDNLSRLFRGESGVFDPPFEIRDKGNVAWKIRKTENLWEHIQSQFIVGERS